MRRTAPLLTLTVPLLVTLGLLVPGPVAASVADDEATSRVVVLLKPGGGAAARGALSAQSVRGEVVTSLPALSGYVADVPAGAVAELAQDPSVAAVEVDGLVRGLGTVQVDPPAGLDRLDQRTGRNGTFAPPATGAGVTAYVLDSGISTTHRDLAGRAVSIRDYVNPTGDGEDCNGHGTHIAGILGGTTYGVAKAVRLRSVRVLDCRNEGYVSTFLRGLDFVVASHAAGTPAVANLSLSSLQPSAVIDAAVRRVVADGVTVVAAAGNDDRDACGASPARVPEVVTVAATGDADRRASFSNSGRCVDLFAPGVQVRSASWLDDTASELRDGTSQAAPHVAGAAALVLQGSPRATPAQVAARLAATSVKGVVVGAQGAKPDLLHVGGGAPAPAAPSNDDLADARPLTGDRGTDTTHLVGATAEPGEPAHAPGNPAVHSLWWTYVAPRDGTLALHLVGDDVDTVLGVYTGSEVGALTRVASNDDGSRTTHASALGVPVRAGQTYRVAVDGFAGETGPITLAHRLTTGPADLAAPRLTALTVTPSTAPVGTGPVVVTVSLRLTDELGARDPVVDLRDSAGRSAGAARARRVSGTAQDGLYRATVVVAKGTRAGTYRVRTYPTRDVVGNTATDPGPPAGLSGVLTVTAGATPPQPAQPGPPRGTPAPPAASPTPTTPRTAAPAVPLPGTGQLFRPLTPVRLLDSRPRTPVRPGTALELPVLGRGGVPASGVTAVLLNVTVTNARGDGHLTAFPTGAARPAASSLNHAAGQVVSNLVVAGPGRGGRVSLFSSAGSPYVLADVVGWYGPAAGGAAYTPVTPARLLDSRPRTPLRPGTAVDVQVTGRAGVPTTGVRAVVLDLTATGARGGGHLTAYPAGTARPATSSLNHRARASAANLVVVPVGRGGRVSVWSSSGSPYVLADVVGWFGPTGAKLRPLVPARVADSRPRTPVLPGTAVRIPVLGRGGVPATGVRAVALNVTATGATGAGHLTAYPTGTTRPATSNVHHARGEVSAQLVWVPVGRDGSVSVWSSGGRPYVVADVVGWFGS